MWTAWPTKSVVVAVSDGARRRVASPAAVLATATCATRTSGGGDERQQAAWPPLWGCYAYRLSACAARRLLTVLRADPAKEMFKGVRKNGGGRVSVLPVDRAIPLIIAQEFGASAIEMLRRPVAFRAPMLQSQLHSKWDLLYLLQNF